MRLGKGGGAAAALLRNQLIRRDRLQASESAWPTLKGTSNFSGKPFRFPEVRGCRGWHHPDLPAGVFPATIPPCSFFPTGLSPLQFAGFFRREARMAVKSAYQALAVGPRRPALAA